MTVKKKRELFLGPLLTSRGSLALPHQKTFDRRRFPLFRGKSPSPAPPALQMHETIELPQPPHAQGTPEERERLATPTQNHVSYPRPGSGILT